MKSEKVPYYKMAMKTKGFLLEGLSWLKKGISFRFLIPLNVSLGFYKDFIKISIRVSLGFRKSFKNPSGTNLNLF
jgi:hypothetical protein